MVCDHGSLTSVQTLSVSEFKATCLAVLQRVKRTGRPVLITRFGEPVAEVVPPRRPVRGGEWLGCMRSRGSIQGDIVGPVLEPRSWEALRK
jgi:prevent-host-death family protein